MFAYVRLCSLFWKKIVEAPTRLFLRKNGVTDRRYSLKRVFQVAVGLAEGWRAARYCQFPLRKPQHSFAFGQSPHYNHADYEFIPTPGRFNREGGPRALGRAAPRFQEA